MTRRTAIIQSTGKVILTEVKDIVFANEYTIVAVSQGDSVEIKVSFEGDRWLVTIKEFGRIISHMFADLIVKGDY